jgi:hypothetical protein
MLHRATPTIAHHVRIAHIAHKWRIVFIAHIAHMGRNGSPAGVFGTRGHR